MRLHKYTTHVRNARHRAVLWQRLRKMGIIGRRPVFYSVRQWDMWQAGVDLKQEDIEYYERRIEQLEWELRKARGTDE